MRTVFYCKSAVKNRLAFYMRSERGEQYLFTEEYRASTKRFFCCGINADKVLNYVGDSEVMRLCGKMKGYVMDDNNLKKIFNMRSGMKKKKVKRFPNRRNYIVREFAIPSVKI